MRTAKIRLPKGAAEWLQMEFVDCSGALSVLLHSQRAVVVVVVVVVPDE